MKFLLPSSAMIIMLEMKTIMYRYFQVAYCLTGHGHAGWREIESKREINWVTVEQFWRPSPELKVNSQKSINEAG